MTMEKWIKINNQLAIFNMFSYIEKYFKLIIYLIVEPKWWPAFPQASYKKNYFQTVVSGAYLGQTIDDP